MVTEKNIIKKMRIEVHTPSVTNGMQLKDEIGIFFKNEIIPEMDTQFIEISKQFSGKLIRFDQIKLNISLDKTLTIKELKPQIISKLKELIIKYSTETDLMNIVQPHILTASKNESDAFLYFIETGTYPWWYDSKKVFTIECFQKMLKVSSFSEILKQKLKEKDIQKRIIFQFDFEMIEAIYTAVSNVKEIQHVSNTVMQTSNFQSLKVPFWTAVFDYNLTHKDARLLQKLDAIVSSNAKRSTKNNAKKYLVETSFMKEASKVFTYISELLNLGIVIKKTKEKSIRLSLEKNTSPSASSKRNDETLKSILSTTVTYNLVDSKKGQDEFIIMDRPKGKTAFTDVSKEGILVENAGLILLHPYIPKLFDVLGFLSKNSEGTINKEIHPEKTTTAVHVLHYLACRKEHPYEHELILEKHLCGLPLEQSLERMITLTKEEKEHCSSLLSAVLSHWTELKTNNIEMLQNEFLAREGKLFILDSVEKIYVQRKTQDILIDKIPWNLTLAKFPWKQKIIHIDW